MDPALTLKISLAPPICPELSVTWLQTRPQQTFVQSCYAKVQWNWAKIEKLLVEFLRMEQVKISQE